MFLIRVHARATTHLPLAAIHLNGQAYHLLGLFQVLVLVSPRVTKIVIDDGVRRIDFQDDFELFFGLGQQPLIIEKARQEVANFDDVARGGILGEHLLTFFFGLLVFFGLNQDANAQMPYRDFLGCPRRS